jgi:cyanophycinase-like exopeptidase
MWPMAEPRLLVIIGSGEMTPRMARVQRAIAARLVDGDGRAAGDVGRVAGDGPAAAAEAGHRRVRAAVIDTPYGFQSNADALSAAALDFFSRRLGLDTEIASYRRADGDALTRETALARIRAADFVFSGPGSPSYALRQWSGSGIPQLLVDKLATRGAISFASAAALTLGRFSVPVYEIYKAGADPHWLPGLDVLSSIGVAAAVVPHFDNAEGAGHDTRFCFIGEQRLLALEAQLPEDVFILGVDEHTALVVDVGTDRARVEGRGAVTVRRHGQSTRHPAGTELPLAILRDTLAAHATDRLVRSAARPASARAMRAAAPGPEALDLADLIRHVLAAEDPAALRASIVMLGERVQRAEGDRERLIEPLLELLLDVRRAARSGGDYARADEIRDRLERLGIRLADEPDGTTDFRLD